MDSYVSSINSPTPICQKTDKKEFNYYIAVNLRDLFVWDIILHCLSFTYSIGRIRIETHLTKLIYVSFSLKKQQEEIKFIWVARGLCWWRSCDDYWRATLMNRNFFMYVAINDLCEEGQVWDRDINVVLCVLLGWQTRWKGLVLYKCQISWSGRATSR